MFQILFQHGTERYVKPCKNILQKDRYLEKLDKRGVSYTVIGEAQPQLCGCIFSVGGQIYTYVRVEGDAEAGNSAEVEVIDEHGDAKLKEVIILWTKETTVEECRKVAASLKRTKLSRIKKVWQRN